MNARLNYSFGFIAGVFYEGMLRMNNYHVKLWMTTHSLDPDSHNVAFDRLKYFGEEILCHSVFVNEDDKESCQKLIEAGAKIMTLPEEPVDQVVGIMMFCKLNAIMERRIVIDEIEIASDLGGHMVYLHNAHENIGPLENAGWWHLADLSHNNVEVDRGTKIMNINRVIGWREVDLDWPTDEPPKDTGNTIVFADFNRNDKK